MPNSQLTLDGTVFDRGGTAVTGGRVTVFNFTKSNESTSVPIGSNGEYTINLANLATQWEAADVIYVVAKNNSANPDYGVVRWVIGGADQAESRDIYLRSGDVFNAAGCSTYRTRARRSEARLTTSTSSTEKRTRCCAFSSARRPGKTTGDSGSLAG